MPRLVPLLAALLLLLAPTPATAQSDAPRVYTMYFQIDFPDLPTWIEKYQQNEVPLLDSLAAEGLLMGYNLGVHDTGGDFGKLLDAYFARMGPMRMQAQSSMVRKHTDEIWALGDLEFPEGWTDRSVVLYESSFHVDYGRLEQWAQDYEAYAKPAMEQAMEEGLVLGWAALHHDTGGGPWNVRFVYWLDSWDAVDDATARMGEIQMELGQEMESARMVRGHADNIWRSVPRRAN